MPKGAKRQAETARPATTRERIDQTAYALFSRRGIRAVGVDDVVAESGVAKMTLYRHYPSKGHLALAFLRRREELWTRSWLEHEVERQAKEPAAQLLAVFDVFDGWFRRADFEGCSFINVLLESSAEDDKIRAAATQHLATIRAFLRRLAERAGIADAEGFARQWHILMKGAIVAAGEGDREAARRAQAIGRLLLAERAPAPTRARPAREKKAEPPRARRARPARRA
jgi:AcrR family transcriptional regulator